MGRALYINILGKDSSVFRSKRNLKVGVSITYPPALVITRYPDGHTRPGISLASCTECILNHHLAEECRVGVWGLYILGKDSSVLQSKRNSKVGVSITYPLALVITPYPDGHTWPGISLASCTECILRCHLAEEWDSYIRWMGLKRLLSPTSLLLLG